MATNLEHPTNQLAHGSPILRYRPWNLTSPKFDTQWLCLIIFHQIRALNPPVLEIADHQSHGFQAMLRLRLLEEGIDIAEMEKKFGVEAIEGLTGRLVRLTAEGLLQRTGSIYLLPRDKVLTSNSILARVLSD